VVSFRAQDLTITVGVAQLSFSVRIHIPFFLQSLEVVVLGELLLTHDHSYCLSREKVRLNAKNPVEYHTLPVPISRETLQTSIAQINSTNERDGMCGKTPGVLGFRLYITGIPRRYEKWAVGE